MEISLLLVSLRLALGLSECGSDQVRTLASPIKCSLQGSNRLPAFTMNGDFVVGGAFSIHYKELTRTHNYTTVPELPSCARGLVTMRSSGEKREGNDNLCQNKYVFRTMLFIVAKLLSCLQYGMNVFISCSNY